MTDAEKREKVIKGLGETLRYCHEMYNGCNNDGQYKLACMNQAAKDALALLKAQEPRVMTVEEAKSAFVVEYRSGKMREVGSALLDLNVDPLNAEYGKIYRVWTSRPTDEQREATPWE